MGPEKPLDVVWDRIVFVVKALFIAVWLATTCMLGILVSLIRYGDISNGHRFAKMLGPGVLRLMGVRLEVHGKERLLEAQPCVYVCNHQSDFDLFILSNVYPPRTVCIGKKEIVKVPFFGLFFKASGNILLDREDHAKAVMGMDAAADRVRNERASVWIFPEGHRNQEPTMLPFKKGAFHLARLAGVPVVPVVWSPIKPLADLKTPHMRGGVIQLYVLQPIPPDNHTVDELVAITRESMEAVHRKLFSPEPGKTTEESAPRID